MTEVQIPVKVLEPAASTGVLERRAWPVSLPLLLFGGGVVLLASIVLLHSQTNYQEVFNIALAHNHQASKIYDFMSPDDPMPLYYMLIHFAAGSLAVSLLTLRLLSLACFVLMLPLAYTTAVRATGDRRVGVLAAVLIGFSPFMVWYASRGTMYAPLALIVLANMYFFVGILQGKNWSWPGYVMTSLLGLGVHFFFAVTLLTQVVFFIADWYQFSKLSKYLMPFASLLFAGTFGYWIYQSNLHSPVWHQLPYTARPVATNVFIIFEQFLFGFQSVEVITFVIALWPLLVILGLLAVQKYVRPGVSVRYFIVAATFPVVALFVAGWFFKPLFLSSYFIVCLPSFMLSAAWYLGTFELPALVLARNVLLITMLLMLFIEIINVPRAITGDYLGAAYQPALRARLSAYDGHHTPAAGPPLQVPSDSPGVLIQSR